MVRRLGGYLGSFFAGGVAGATLDTPVVPVLIGVGILFAVSRFK